MPLSSRARGAAALLVLAAAAATAAPASAQTGAPAAQPPADAIPAHETLRLDSRILGERRVINVHVPAAYAASPRRAFPVLYMPDGGIAEDFPHVVNTLDSLVALGEVAPMIVVGIENTERRRDLTGPTAVASDSTIAPRVGGSAAFRRFIRDELMPEIRARYATTDETAIVGESLAGLFVVETFLLEPTLFRRYVAMSPSLWWNGDALVRDAAGRLGPAAAGRTLYLTAANEEGIADETASLAATLKADAPRGLVWHYMPRPDLEHSTIFRGMAPAAFVAALPHP